LVAFLFLVAVLLSVATAQVTETAGVVRLEAESFSGSTARTIGDISLRLDLTIKQALKYKSERLYSFVTLSGLTSLVV
jgi:hypothetical protein